MKPKRKMSAQLEIGPGRSPILKKGILLERANWLCRNLQKQKNTKGRVLRAHQQYIPLKDESVSKIEARMPEIFGFGYTKKEANETLREASRVLKKGGTLTISARSTDRQYLLQFLKKSSLKLMSESSSPETWWERRISNEPVTFPGARQIVILKFKKA